MVNSKIWSPPLVENERVKSSDLNTLQNELANSVDKTGETAALGGGVVGPIEILSGGSVKFVTGSFFQVQTGATGTFQGGSSLVVATGAVAQLNGTVNIGSSDITFAKGVVGPTIQQTTTSGNGQDMLIQAQSASGYGGDLLLYAGQGASNNYGQVIIGQPNYEILAVGGTPSGAPGGLQFPGYTQVNLSSVGSSVYLTYTDFIYGHIEFIGTLGSNCEVIFPFLSNTPNMWVCSFQSPFSFNGYTVTFGNTFGSASSLQLTTDAMVIVMQDSSGHIGVVKGT
jgi:hypothetical protein